MSILQQKLTSVVYCLPDNLNFGGNMLDAAEEQIKCLLGMQLLTLKSTSLRSWFCGMCSVVLS